MIFSVKNESANIKSIHRTDYPPAQLLQLLFLPRFFVLMVPRHKETASIDDISHGTSLELAPNCTCARLHLAAAATMWTYISVFKTLIIATKKKGDGTIVFSLHSVKRSNIIFAMEDPAGCKILFFFFLPSFLCVLTFT